MHSNSGRLRIRGSSRRYGFAVFVGVAGLCTATSMARAVDGPTLNKTSVLVDPWQLQGYWAPGATEPVLRTTSWIPRVKFSATGPVPAGAKFLVDFTRPDGSAWMQLDCPTDEAKAGESEDFETRHNDADEKKGTKAVGVFGFKIRYKSAPTAAVRDLFSGKFKVGKVSKSNGNAADKNKFDFYVDHDWVLPIGYVWFYDPDGDQAMLAAGTWTKGEVNASKLTLEVDFNGNKIASVDGADNPIVIRTADGDKGDPHWEFAEFHLPTIRRSDPKAADGGASRFPGAFLIDKNPGDYEVKITLDGQPYRTTKFSIGADGALADNGLGAANELGTKRVLLPVKVLGTKDGTYNKSAWKTDAFYGNPIKGFTAP